MGGEASVLEVPGPVPTDEEVRAALKFRNGDVSLDEAVERLIEAVGNGYDFTIPNADLLIQAANDTPWD